jgi:hypothetical protein
LGGALKGRAIERLRKLDDGIWTLQGDPVRFFTFPYELRSTIVDLGGKLLFVHSPIQLSVAAGAVESLGRVGYIVSPNKMHHLFLGEWGAAFPDARIYSPPGLRSKRPDLCFHGDLGDEPEDVWASVLDQRVVRGSLFMEEAVFFHLPSRTLILGDLIENHDPEALTVWHRAVARANDMLAPHGTTARIYRLSFWRRAEARRVINEILSWQARRVVVMHGPCVEDNAVAFLRHAFSWLL